MVKMKDRIARSVFWMVWSRGGVQILSFVGTLMVARLLSPRDYGLMALAGIWIGSIELLAEMGLGAAIVQFRDLDDRELNACFWVTMGVATSAYGALFLAAPAIAAWFQAPALAEVLRVAGLTLPLVAIRVVPDGLLRKRLALDKISQAEIVAGVITIPVTVGLAWAGAGVWALVAGALSLPLVQTLVTFCFAHWRPGLVVTGPRIREILRYSAASLGARVSWAVFQQTDALVLGKVAGESVLGLYSMAMRLATLPVSKVSVVANQLAMPIMAELQADRDAMRASFLRGLRLVACLTVPLCVGVALVAGDLVPVVLTEKWLPAVPVLQVLCVFALIRSVDTLFPPVLFARYRVAYLFWWTMALLLVMPLAFWVGATWSGALGASLAWVVVYPLAMAPMARQALRELELSFKGLWAEVRAVLDAALLMALAVIAVHWALPGADAATRLVRLVLASGAGAVVYGLGIFWRGGLVFREMAEVVGWIFRRSHPLPTSK